MTEPELRELLARVSGRDVTAIELDDDLTETLELDSLTGLRMLAAVEKHGGVRFPDSRLDEFRSLRQILDFVDQGDDI